MIDFSRQRSETFQENIFVKRFIILNGFELMDFDKIIGFIILGDKVVEGYNGEYENYCIMGNIEDENKHIVSIFIKRGFTSKEEAMHWIVNKLQNELIKI